MICVLDTVGTDVVLRYPVDWTTVSSVTPEVSCPPPNRFVVVGVPNLGALIVVGEPPFLVSDHLVVVVVEKLSSSGGPDISEQRVVDVQSAEGMSPHDGHSFLTIKPKVIFEEVQSLSAVSHRVRVDFFLYSDVWSRSVLGHTVRTAGPEGDSSVENDLTVSLSLQVVTLSWDRGRVIALHVVGLNAPLHGHDGS